MFDKSTVTFRVFRIRYFLILCFVYSSIGLVSGIVVNEKGFGSLVPNVDAFSKSMSRQSNLVADSPPQDRGKFLKRLGMEACRLTTSFCCTFSTLMFRNVPLSHAVDRNHVKYADAVHHPFRYSNDWTGTSLQVVDISTAVSQAIPIQKSRNGSVIKYRWPMGRWPDPILRLSADPVDKSLFGSNVLRQACDMLRNTAVAEGAVGLAAQQCGVNARIIYLEIPTNSFLLLINPRIIRRSSELAVKVWRENCLVLPPSFQATVLRDAWVDVEYQDWQGKFPYSVKRFCGELARALQHEMDHDRGILVTDHVSLDELESGQMRLIERPGHEIRMATAYDRYIN
jgi:peptide deformylase